VQQQNVALFEKLNWRLHGPVQLHGRPHGLMEASLAHYPPCHEPDWGYFTLPQARARTAAAVGGDRA
jgi:hypothetical protein